MAMPPTETHDKMTASCGKPYGIFARKTTPRPKPLRQSYLRENLQITLFPMDFLKLKKNKFLPSSCLLLRRPEEVSTSKKENANKIGGHIGVTVCSLSASSTEKHSMKPTAIAALNNSSTPTNIIGTFSRGKQLKNSMLSFAGFRVFQFTLPKFNSEFAHEKLPRKPIGVRQKYSLAVPPFFRG